MRRQNLAVPIFAALLVTLAVGTLAASASAAVTVKTVRGPVVDLRAPTSTVDVYDVHERASAFCGKGGTPLTAGWTDAGAPVSSVRSLLNSINSYVEVNVRRPMAAGRIRAYAVCAKGPVKAKIKSADGATVSCGRKLAIGVPLTSTWPYHEQAHEAKLLDKSRWTTSVPYSDATATCVASSAFGKRKAVRRSTKFVVGRQTASVKATCAGERRPIGWGFAAPVLIGNAWDSADTSSRITVPFVSAATPAGKRGWKLTFRTPDGKGATTPAQVTLHLTCAVPR